MRMHLPKRCDGTTPLPKGLTLTVGMVALVMAGRAEAQMPMGSSTQFDITGFIEEASLGGPGAGPGTGAHAGGTIKVNGHTVTVPSETIVMLPANALTWAELFSQAPAPYTGAATGMALADFPPPITTYEAHVVGNRVLGATPNEYIAGLVFISQQSLNSGAGYINCIVYDTADGLHQAEMRVGGTIGDCTTGTRVRLNDPVGRFGRAQTPDQRFTVDADNPTIKSETGFPMCVPRVLLDPTIAGNADDPLCPQANRPSVGGSFVASVQMNNPITNPGVPPDATRQAPLEVGDYVTFAGTLVQDGANPTASTGAFPGVPGTYVSAHTITNNVAIYTWPGTDPAYVSVDVGLIGTGGLTVLGGGEATIRTRFEGMTTDPTRNIHLYGIDVNPADGSTTDRDWGTIGVDPGAPNGAVKGRWRFRPPCTATAATVSDKACSPPPAGTFLPPTREVRAVIEGLQSQANPVTALTAANGIIYGQYHAPIFEYIFPENIPGSPIVPNNFNTIPFLAVGGYTSTAGTLVGQLNPWPDSTVPAPACPLPVASAGGPYSVTAGGTVTLAGSATGTAPTFQWAAPSAGTLSDPAVANPVYTAPAAAQTVTLSLIATNACGTSAPATTTVTVAAVGTPTITAPASVSVASGAAGSFTASASPAGVALTVSQTGAPALLNLAVSAGGNVTFTAPTLPLGQVTPATVSVTVTATNAGGSASAVTTVTVNPLQDAIAITSAEYRTSKQRLIINATSSVISPNVVLTLAPYLTTGGTTFDPANLGATFTNNGGGLYILTLVGAPEPAVPPATPLVVTSNLGGASPAHGLDRIRQ